MGGGIDTAASNLKYSGEIGFNNLIYPIPDRANTRIMSDLAHLHLRIGWGREKSASRKGVAPIIGSLVVRE
jgi:hypothetical protein